MAEKITSEISEGSFDLEADRAHKEACLETTVLKSELDGIKFKGYSKVTDKNTVTLGKLME